MRKYEKISKMDVLKAYLTVDCFDIISCRQHPVSRNLISLHLRTSVYQVNKYCKELIAEGLLKVERVEPFHDYDYESGYDYGNNLSILVTDLTDRGYEKAREMGWIR